MKYLDRLLEIEGLAPVAEQKEKSSTLKPPSKPSKGSKPQNTQNNLPDKVTLKTFKTFKTLKSPEPRKHGLGQERPKPTETHERGTNARESALLPWSILSGAESSRAVHSLRLQCWEAIEMAAHGSKELPTLSAARVLDENERLLYLTSLITKERRQFTPDETAQVESALSHLDMMQSGVIPLDEGGFSWIDPEYLYENAVYIGKQRTAESRAREVAEQQPFDFHQKVAAWIQNELKERAL